MGKISSGLHKICQVFIGLSLLVVVFVLTVNVVLRYIFASSWVWAEEISRYLVAWCTFVGAACCVTEGSDITIDSIVSLFSKKGRNRLSIVTTAICIVFSVAFLYSSFLMTMRAFQNGQMATSFKMPLWVAYASMPVGAALTLIRFAEKLILLIRGGASASEAVQEEG